MQCSQYIILIAHRSEEKEACAQDLTQSPNSEAVTAVTYYGLKPSHNLYIILGSLLQRNNQFGGTHTYEARCEPILTPIIRFKIPENV